MQTTTTVLAAASVTLAGWLAAPSFLNQIIPPPTWLEFGPVSVLESPAAPDAFSIVYSAQKSRDCHAAADWLFVTVDGGELKDERGSVSASLNHRMARPDAYTFSVVVMRPRMAAGVVGYKVTITPDDPACGRPVTAPIAWLPAPA
jgi:hypothetical protein